MAQRTLEVPSVRRTDDPLVISRTDGGFRASSPADPTQSSFVSKNESRNLIVSAQRSSFTEVLIQDHLYLVTDIARRLARRFPPSVDVDDLIADGHVGLVGAARAFVPARGTSFKTFARYRIRGAMLDGLRALDPRSRSVRGQRRAVERSISSLTNLLGRLPAEDEIAQSMGFDGERWRELRRRLYAAGYLLSVDPCRRAVPEPDLLPGTTDDPEFLAANAALRTKLDDALHIISPRYRAVIVLYYVRGWTMTQIGMELGVNESRVSQIHKRAIAMLRAQLSPHRSDLGV